VEAKLIKIHRPGLLTWEAVVEDGNVVYYYNAWTRRGARTQADRHIQKGYKA
jgi:hypothetical protein